MGYQVLARKYRPQRFADVAGQDHVTRTLMNALGQNRIAHGYIFSGHRGIGKTTIARIVAQALNCRTSIGSPQRPTPEPCAVCDSCVEIRQGNAVDVIEIDAATNRGIDEIRELRDAARYAPSRDRYKIYILDEAHQITDAAFNALLKTLEEPPAHVIFMMATTEPENIPQTIRSRCQHFSFHAVKFDDILAQLRMIAAAEQVQAEDAALALLAEAGDGSMRDALSIMDQAIASAPLDEGRPVLSGAQIRELMGSVPNAIFERLLEAVSAGESAQLMEQLNLLVNAGHSPSSLARQMVRYLRNALMAKLGGEQTELLQISGDERARAARTAQLFSEEELTRNLQIILRTFDDLNYRQEQRFHLELGLLKLIHAQRLLPLEQLLSGALGAPAPGAGARTPPASAAVRGSAQPAEARAAASAPAAPIKTPPTPAARLDSPFGPETGGWSPGPQSSGSQSSGSPTSGSPTSGSPTSGSPSSGPPSSELQSSRSQPPARAHAPERETKPAELKEPGLKATPGSTFEPPTASPVMATEIGLNQAMAVTPFAPTEAPAPVDGSRAPGGEDLPAGAPQMAAPAVAAPNLESVRQAIGAALVEGGHNSAAQLLGISEWTMEATSLRMEVPGIGKKMLALTFNAAAEKILRLQLQKLGAPTRFLIVPGEGVSSGNGFREAPPLAGSIQEAALANPLVQRAKEIFRAEVRSVVDLRQK